MMLKFSIQIEPEAFNDIQNAIDYYNSCQPGLGKRFYQTIDTQLKFLRSNYTLFAVRYDDIRCMNVEKFPYMIHYLVLSDQQTISIKAIFSTHENPEKWERRK
jgi:hypothetical protein